MHKITRRSFLRTSLATAVSVPFSGAIGSAARARSSQGSTTILGALSGPDANGVMLPAGFSSRVVARSGVKAHSGSSYVWHDAPDGGATFPTDDGGWIYVSNSEVADGFGGAGALRFDASGNVVDSYSILEGTSRNCAGGATPWGTWLSCEEVNEGMVWECDPSGKQEAVPRPALGVFAHEAVAVDTRSHVLYLTEDKRKGCFYRFIPASITKAGYPDLSSGTLEVAVVDKKTLLVNWLPVPDPSASSKPTRYQVSSSTVFKGGEGIVYYHGVVSFATKGDNRIWSYNTETKQISVIYDARTHINPILKGVDNITLTQGGELIVSEDGDDLQVVKITKDNELVPLAQLIGHDASEVTGPAFSPDGKRLYFSSQRGITGSSNAGITFEITGPFHG
jgi:secreted PhoX family phosphatase